MTRRPASFQALTMRRAGQTIAGMRMLLLGVILGLLWPAFGAKAANAMLQAEGGEKMVTRYLFLHPTMIKKGIGKPEKDPMPAAKGERATVRNVGNAREYLESMGITFPPGATLTYSARNNLLVVHSTPENLERIEGAIASGPCEVDLHHIRIETRLVEFHPTAAAQLEIAGTFADLSKKLGEKMKTVYANQITVKTGNRTDAEIPREDTFLKRPVRTPTKPQPRKYPDDPMLSFEPQIGPDGFSTDFRVEFEYTIPDGKGGVRLKMDENSRALDGQIKLVKVFSEPAPADGAAPREFALLVRCEILETDGQPRARAAAGGAKK